MVEDDVEEHLEFGRLLGEVDHDLLEAAEVAETQIHEAVRQRVGRRRRLQGPDRLARRHGMLLDDRVHPGPDALPDAAPRVDVFAGDVVAAHGVVVARTRRLLVGARDRVAGDDRVEFLAVLHPRGREEVDRDGNELGVLERHGLHAIFFRAHG